ncbi:MAG: DNA internalization-related competence protein ComEC/Rec2 [Candidatus Sumerlaeia bacterium]|nr:DNA internalization-related competence protein ComEC/Rec2 [Candidatus Sumerlaeia bacterium]
MYRHPALVLVAYLMAGLILGRFFRLPSAVFFAVCGILILFYSWIYFVRPKLKRLLPELSPAVSGQLIFLGILLLGVYRQNQIVSEEKSARQQIAEIEQAGVVNIAGQVAGLPIYRQKSILLPLKNIQISTGERSWRLPGRLQAIIGGKLKESFPHGSLVRGDLIEIRGRVLKPPSTANPSVFNYSAYLRQRGVYGTVPVYSKGMLKISSPASGRSPFNLFLQVVDKIRGYADKKITAQFRPEIAPIIYAMIFGNTYNLPPQERRRFVDTGLAHLFSVSGLHTGLVALMLFGAVLTLTLNLRFAIIITMVGLIGYSALVGFKTPVLRAVFMANSYLLLLLLLRRPITGIDAFATSAFIILLLNPRALFQADFQLSYLAVMGIFMLTPVLQELFRLQVMEGSRWRYLAEFINRKILMPFQVVIAVQLFLLPLLVIYFHRFSLVSFVANVLAVPLAFFIILFGGIYLLCEAILPLFAPLFALLAGCVTEALLFIIKNLSSLPYAAIYIEPMPWWAIGLYYTLLFGGSYITGLQTPIARWRGKAQFLIITLAICGLLVWLPFVQQPQRLLEVYFLDVGQGDATYLEFPNDNNLLIDGGRFHPKDMGEAVIAPFLIAKGIDEINVIVATHPDADHIGGLPYILENFFVGVLIENGEEVDTRSFKDLQQTAKSTGTPIRVVRRGDEIRGFSPAKILVLHPDADTLNDSIVLRVVYNHIAIIFPGDVKAEGEQSILQSGSILTADILKAGHHGSKTSTTEEFLEAVAPQVVIFSCGKNNPYGHPDMAVIERCCARGIKTFRTDEQGCITLTTNGVWLKIHTEK